MSNVFYNLKGTSNTIYQIGKLGVNLKNSSGNLLVRNAADSADATLTTSQLLNSGNSIILNSDAAGSGADWTYTFARPAAGMTAAVTLTFPIDDGAPGEVLSTDGSGNLSWASNSSNPQGEVTYTVPVAFGDSSPITAFTLPTDGVVDWIKIITRTVFNGTAPTLTTGVNGGSASLFTTTAQSDLKTAGGYTNDVTDIDQTSLASQDIELTYVPDSSSAGAAEVVFFYHVSN